MNNRIREIVDMNYNYFSKNMLCPLVIILFGINIFLILTVSALSEQQKLPRESQVLPSKGPFQVTHVIDGDTIILENGETVRLIGVDAPESNHPEIPVQRFQKESAEFLQRMVEGFKCTLEYEPQEIRDQYGRLLAYIHVGDLFVNAEMIRRGYAYAYTRFSFRYQDEFVKLEREAREKQYGLWSLSLKDGRITNLVNKYESLNIEGRKKLDEILDSLLQEYPVEKQTSSQQKDLPENAKHEKPADGKKQGKVQATIPIISWQDADKHYGEYVTVEGKIVRTYNSGKACFLSFHPNYKRYFAVVIFASAFPRFPSNPEDYYNNKKVRVTGYIKEYKGKPEIILNEPEQIEIVSQ